MPAHVTERVSPAPTSIGVACSVIGGTGPAAPAPIVATNASPHGDEE